MSLNNLGDDFMSSMATSSEKLINTILAIIKAVESHKKYKMEMSIMKSQLEKAKPVDNSKVTFGKMTEKEYNAIKGSESISLQYVESSKLGIIEEYAKKLGAKYFVFENDGVKAGIAVPDKYISQFNNVIKVALEKQLSENDNSLVVNDNDKIIKAEDKLIVDEVMNFHELPVYKFDVGEDRMNVVPKEYEGQYYAALNEAYGIKEQLNNMEITFFEQQDTSITALDYRVTEVNSEQAGYIASEITDARMAFMEDDGKLYCKYPAERESDVTAAINNYTESTRIAEEYKIDIIDNKITINKSLIETETDTDYLLRVPNTGGKDYIRLDKSEVQFADGGKTLTAHLDFDKTYKIYEKDGKFKETRTGKELAVSYNTKSRNGNDHTVTSHHFNDNLERIELYNAKDNTMMRIGLEGVSAEQVKSILLSKGISAPAAEKLCADIAKAIPQKFKDSFAFTPVSKQITITDNGLSTKNIIEQGKLAKAIEGAENSRPLITGVSNARNCCILDKKNNKYFIFNADDTRQEVTNDLQYCMKYNPLVANCIVKSALQFADDGELANEVNAVMSFDTKNPEIASLKFAAADDIIVITKPEVIDGETEFKNIVIQGNASMSEIEKAVSEKLGIKDSLSVAECMRCMSESHLIEPPKTAEIKIDDKTFNITKVSSECFNLNFGDKTVMMPVKDISVHKLVKDLQIDEKTAAALHKSVEKKMSQAVRADNTSSISQLKKKAAEMFRATSATAEKAAEKTVDAAKTIANLVKTR